MSKATDLKILKNKNEMESVIQQLAIIGYYKKFNTRFILAGYQYLGNLEINLTSLMME